MKPDEEDCINDDKNREEAYQNIKKAQERQKKNYKGVERNFRVGQKVYAREHRGINKKSWSKAVITKKLGKATYLCTLEEGKGECKKHTDQLRPRLDRKDLVLGGEKTGMEESHHYVGAKPKISHFSPNNRQIFDSQIGSAHISSPKIGRIPNYMFETPSISKTTDQFTNNNLFQLENNTALSRDLSDLPACQSFDINSQSNDNSTKSSNYSPCSSKSLLHFTNKDLTFQRTEVSITPLSIAGPSHECTDLNVNCDNDYLSDQSDFALSENLNEFNLSLKDSMLDSSKLLKIRKSKNLKTADEESAIQSKDSCRDKFKRGVDSSFKISKESDNESKNLSLFYYLKQK